MSSCSIVYKDQSFATPQELIKYARENNIREILDVVDRKPFYQMSQKDYPMDKAIAELDEHLLNYLKPFGVKSKEFDELKSRLGIDALGATDILNKLIWYSKDRNVETIPEEFGHMITFLMGENNPIIKDLLSDISSWSGFNEVKRVYDPIYKNDKQVKIEAVGKLIAKALVKNYKAYGTDQNLLQKALKA